ncbi:hypothetical protein [Actinomadura citrea]|uniref:hypothetical protein n=1 Tax=Actinomadura citrea TaxID=46158 RepID=UPI0039A75DFF
MIEKSSDVQTFGLLLAVGLVVSQLAARARRLRVIAITDADYLARIRDTAELAQSSKGPDSLVDRVCEHLTAPPTPW